MVKQFFPVFILCSLFLSSCGTSGSSETIPAIDQEAGKSYFFLEEGKFREYEVYEIRYHAVGLSDTLAYQLREEVKESFTNNGVRSNVIHRFSRIDENQEWSLDSVWSARVERDRAISMENNIPILKMTFPSLQERTWDGNLFNTRQEDEFKVITFDPTQNDENQTSFRVPVAGSAASFTEVLVIEHESFEDFVDKDVRMEVYKDSVGLVYKEYETLKYCTTNSVCDYDPTMPGEFVVSGRYYREILLTHGFIDNEN
ncbi:MAG: hypothetical protein HEP71_26215 [Roseivirga sp.]|nr:hypothetical protein [Roseivirga sp.]